MSDDQEVSSKLNNDNLSILPDGFLVLEDDGKMFQVNHGSLTPYVAETVAVAPKKQAPALNELMDTGMEEPMLQPPPLAVLRKTASFYFHPDDEEEVGLVSNKLDQASVRQFSIQKIITKAVATFGLKLSDQENKKFSQLIFAALRDRRSLPETEALLADSVSPLGVGLPAALAGGITVFISQIKNKISSEGGLVVDETQIKPEAILKNPVVKTDTDNSIIKADTVNIASQTINNNQVAEPLKDIDPSVFSRPKKKTSVIEEIANEIKRGYGGQSVMPKEVVPEPKQVFKEATSPVNDEFNVSLNLRTSVNQKMVDEEEIEKKVVEEKPASQNLSRFVNQSKAVVNDIKIDNKSLGPIDELGLMNLATFRRLSPDPVVAGQRVSAIINALGKQSLARKTAGIRAWRSSPLYKQYLLIGQVSMEGSRTVPDVIADLKNKGEVGLTIAEFETIGDINRLTRM
jgi:hypothetical protein